MESPARKPVIHRPDHRDLYILVAGVVLGILLGPAVLGRLEPVLYDRWFIGVDQAERELQAFELETQATRQRLAETGVTETAIQELERGLDAQRAVLLAKLDHASREHGLAMRRRMAALVMALVAVMVIEPLVDPAQRRLRGRVVTARYLLLALWLALMLAQPRLIQELPLGLLGFLVACVLLIVLLPLPGRQRASSPPSDRAGA